MRVKKTNILFTVACLIGFIFILVLLGRNRSPFDEKDELSALESKIKQLEGDLKNNYEMVNSIGKSLAELLNQSGNEKQSESIASIPDHEETTETCPSKPLKPDIQMLDVYEKLKFDNPDGGVWKQGWEVQYEADRFASNKKLKVFVVPHSHNDPGWIKTFQRYYEDQTKHILNNMVRKVGEEAQRKFIWAEISYLDLWWRESDDETRDKFKQLVKNGQIEIVTGGWVMNDEANTHYYSMIEQLTSGHEWMRQKLGTTPKNGWAIDPFGYSSSMAYLLKRSGFDNMVIQRVHYAIKKAFAFNKTLEFRWRQNWDTDGKTDMFCHMMPFYSYDVPHTCGPDPKVCCQFDFRRMNIPGQKLITCPWRINPQPIIAANVHKKAAMLLDQYRKKSSLYKTNVLLVQLGDDFRYDSAAEFDNQYVNYEKLFEYMNSQRDWHVEAKFGTLQDYFNELHSSSELNSFPALGGDLFTYADIDDHYWSGYYTTRPFYKHLERILVHYLRSAEIVYSLTYSHLNRRNMMNANTRNWMNRLMKQLTDSRHNLALFQHHDGITGTAKDHVVQDYAEMMQQSIQNAQTILDQCAYFLLNKNQATFEPDVQAHYFNVDELYTKANELPKKIMINLNDKQTIVLFNSLASERIQTVTLRLNAYNVEVIDSSSSGVPVQIDPIFDTPYQISSKEFEISWQVKVPPLGMTTYTIQKFQGSLKDNANLKIAKVSVKDLRSVESVGPFDVETVHQLEPFALSNDKLTAQFSADGLLKSITRGNTKTPVSIKFIKYGTRNEQHMSGAYLFLPDGPAKQLEPEANHHVRLLRGVIRSQVTVYVPFVVHQVTLNRESEGLMIDNMVNVAGQYNIEVGMRIETGIDSGNASYSDLNGLQMTRRQRWGKLPLQAQYYPMPSMAYIEDESTRLTIASRQPLGVASLQSGQLEVLMDRRLNQDDNRGLGQGVTDNVIPTLNSFRLMVEQRTCQDTYGRPDGYASLSAQSELFSLLYPVHRLVSVDGAADLHDEFKPSSALANDVHLVNLRTGAVLPDDEAVRASDSVSLLVHRIGTDCCLPSASSSNIKHGHLTISSLFPDYFNEKVKATSLTGNEAGERIDKSFTLKLKPMEMYAFHLEP